MQKLFQILTGAVRSAAVIAILFASYSNAEAPLSATTTQKVAVNTPVVSETELAATQEQLLKLLRTSPTLTAVIERDPSLLSNQDYVARNNPALAQFLFSHPEVARNPDFYLFAGLKGEGRQSDNALQRKVWPEFSQPQQNDLLGDVVRFIGPFLIFFCFLAVLVWLIHTLLENRRWGRIFNLQMEAHGKLIDRFSNNQELLVYMNTEAGKRFLEAAPIAADLEHGQRVPSAVARILNPIQIGVVLTMLGAGLLFLRSSVAEITVPLLVVGVVVLMSGLGFILSAGITWVLAGRLGLMPQGTKATDNVDEHSASKERL